jgi:dephospho-CoA kinase
VVRVALTGGIASGKSHVLRGLAARGVPTIDADRLAHEALAPESPGAAAVVARFGPGVVNADGRIDRRALGAIVFGDAQARHALEAIVHPAVYDAIARWFTRLPPETPLAVADIPLLYETGHERDVDVVIAAACPPDEQLRRVMSRDNLSEADARARLASQWPMDEKVRRADHVIWTSGTFAETERQIEEVIERLRSART